MAPKFVKVHCQEKANTMQVTKDGRPWARFVPFTRQGLCGTRRIAKCSGTITCPNKHCSYEMEFGKENVTQFTSNGDKRTCMHYHCNKNVKEIPCPARTNKEIPPNVKLTVHHFDICKEKPKKKK